MITRKPIDLHYKAGQVAHVRLELKRWMVTMATRHAMSNGSYISLVIKILEINVCKNSFYIMFFFKLLLLFL